jgi:hypothetical protein
MTDAEIIKHLATLIGLAAKLAIITADIAADMVKESR